MDDAGRYRLTLSTGDEPAVHGWWTKESTARRKFAGMVHQQSNRDGARLRLVDTETDEQLAVWSKPEASPAA
ncbi:hypothetical protein ABZ890_45660 [Streptomyces sp. NPDC046984]|uniref:hypothetical protein n=1 Tax=Streptomyces sp. NPDC046984 TaxID=3155138 RepID=UPI0033CA5202